MSTADSVYELKSGFLSSQVRILGSIPEPPKDWQDSVPASEYGDLSDSVLAQVYYKLGIVARKHQKMVYSTQALRHVAEQIDALYWDQSDGVEGAPPRQEEVLRRGVDLKDPENIEALPETFPATGDESEDDLERYQELRSRLVHSADVLQAVRQKHAYYKHLEAMVEPFRNPAENVQPNIVTRDGLLGHELERMRMLAAKLAVQIETASGVQMGTASVTQQDDREAGSGVDQRLRRILEGS